MIEVERVDYISVPTRDLERAKRFYGETLGLPHEKDTPVGAEYRAGQVTVGIVTSADVGAEFAPNRAGFALRVPDVDAAHDELVGAGVDFETDVLDTGVCRLAFFSDPDGNRLVLHRRYAP
jgi:predicted enzyme related to lactoylglutathione lyase